VIQQKVLPTDGNRHSAFYTGGSPAQARRISSRIAWRFDLSGVPIRVLGREKRGFIDAVFRHPDFP
jgi:hypothetical protein